MATQEKTILELLGIAGARYIETTELSHKMPGDYTKRPSLCRMVDDAINRLRFALQDFNATAVDVCAGIKDSQVLEESPTDA